MKLTAPLTLTAALLACASLTVQASAINTLQSEYQATGAGPFNATAGKRMWTQKNTHKKSDGKQRSCTTCHTDNLKASSKHVKTGKVIEPLAPSVNAERLTKTKKINKWFKRNCKWTLGRECSPQEKGDFLAYINSL